MNLFSTTFAAVQFGSSFGSPIGTGANNVGIGSLISLFLSGSIVVAGIIFIFLLLGGAFMMIQGAGNSDPKASANGKQAVTGALLGFIVILSAFFIINAVERILGYRFLTSPTLQPQF